MCVSVCAANCVHYELEATSEHIFMAFGDSLHLSQWFFSFFFSTLKIFSLVVSSGTSLFTKKTWFLWTKRAFFCSLQPTRTFPIREPLSAAGERSDLLVYRRRTEVWSRALLRRFEGLCPTSNVVCSQGKFFLEKEEKGVHFAPLSHLTCASSILL